MKFVDEYDRKVVDTGNDPFLVISFRTSATFK